MTKQVILSETNVPGEALLHPVNLLALGLWWLNDAVLKAHFHNWITGKLSDICCMIVFPVLVISILQSFQALRGAAWRPRRQHVIATLAAVGGLFTGINLFPAIAAVYQSVFAIVLFPFLAVFKGATALPSISHTTDPSDLLTLPGLAVAYLLTPKVQRPATASVVPACSGTISAEPR